jgi:[ribosomal protein S5]-alanine N-acetyltransferase
VTGRLRGDPAGVHLRSPHPCDAATFLAAVEASRELHRPWTAPPDTPALVTAYLDRAAASAERPDEATHLSYLVWSGDELVGVVNANEIVRRSLQSAFLGYSAFVPHAGTGRMRRGLALVVDELFGPRHLHRVEANVQPGNLRSRRLVERLGFRHEGSSPRYLKVDGEWRDHERYALLIDEWPGADVASA